MYLYGASGHAKVISEILEANGIVVEAFIDDNPTMNEFCGKRVLHTPQKGASMLISIGNNKIRKKIAQQFDGRYESALHPSAIISKSAKIGTGSVVMQGAIIQADAHIGDHCIINTASSIDHECIIEDFVHLSPNATLCGNVKVGEGTHIGAGAVIIQGIKIGKWATIGAGAVVTKDIPDNATAVGIPAKIIKVNP